jgi:hypothetical protein
MSRILLAILFFASFVMPVSSAGEPQRWCSPEGYDQPAELVIFDDGPVIKINGKVTEHLNKVFWREKVIFTTMDYEHGGMMYRDQKLAIYHDRIFWPCS